MGVRGRMLQVRVCSLISLIPSVGLADHKLVITLIPEIAFVGKAPGSYMMLLGGGYYGQRLNKIYRGARFIPYYVSRDQVVDYPMQKRSQSRKFLRFCGP